MTLFRIILVGAALLCSGMMTAWAESPMSAEIDVAATATNATDARAKALKEGELKAFRQLLEQYIPDRANDIATHMPPEQVSAMVTGFELVKEKVAANSYQARVIISFDPRQMKRLIGNAPAPVAGDGAPALSMGMGEAAPSAPAMMVLPVMRRDGSVYLWEGDNFWRNVWNSVALETGSGHMVMPYGDPNDLRLLRSENALNASPGVLLQLAKRYGSSDVLLALASYRSDSPVTALDITLTRMNARQRKTSRATYMAEDGESYEALLVRAANDIARRLLDDAEMAASLSGGHGGDVPVASIVAVARTPRVQDWNQLRERLEKLPAVQAVTPSEMGYGQVTLNILYRGTPETLGKSLMAADLAVSRSGNMLMLALN